MQLHSAKSGRDASPIPEAKRPVEKPPEKKKPVVVPPTMKPVPAVKESREATVSHAREKATVHWRQSDQNASRKREHGADLQER